MAAPHRYFVRSPDGRALYGFDKEATAAAVALEYGAGAAVIDTLAQAYMPMLQVAERSDGALKLVFQPIGGWDTGRFTLDRDLIEAIKRGRIEIVHAYLAKGAAGAARDAEGRSALHWAAAKGDLGIVQLLVAEGADVNFRDASNRTPRDVAQARGKTDVAAWLATH